MNVGQRVRVRNGCSWWYQDGTPIERSLGTVTRVHANTVEILMDDFGATTLFLTSVTPLSPLEILAREA